jgi:hypothetical protein
MSATAPMRPKVQSTPDGLTTSPGVGTAPGVGAAPAPSPAPAPAFASAPAPAPAPTSASAGDDAVVIAHALAKRLVEESVGPLRRSIEELSRRIEELERRPVGGVITTRQLPALTDDSAPTLIEADPRPLAPAAPRVPPPAPALAPVVHAMPAARPAAPVGETMGLVSVIPAPPPKAVAWSVAPMGPVLDIAAIERSGGDDIDSPFNGRRRKRVLAVTVILFLLLAVGGALGGLANNNSQPNVVPAPVSS